MGELTLLMERRPGAAAAEGHVAGPLCADSDRTGREDTEQEEEQSAPRGQMPRPGEPKPEQCGDGQTAGLSRQHGRAQSRPTPKGFPASEALGLS